ncbi:MAG: hypothetical protein M3X11_04825 [Acidobacteriota bacterium]|nr:hypothetical protein [Acidobacteriota bacterium]
MPLHLYPNVHSSGSVPAEWHPVKGGAIKYPVRNRAVHSYLRQLLPGKWQKVIKQGNIGEVHYFEHESSQVAGVKFFPNQPL